MNINSELGQLEDMYKDIEKFQSDLNKKYKGKKIKIDENFKFNQFGKYCFNFRIDYIDVTEDDIEILYDYNDREEYTTNCVDGFTFEEFIENVEIETLDTQGLRNLKKE